MNYSVYAVFGLAVLAGAFFLWVESRKDGFDEEKTFDIYFFGLLLALFLGKLYPWVLGKFFGMKLGELVIPLYLLGFIAGVFLICRRYKWSVYRVADNITLAFLFGFAFFCLGRFLFNFRSWEYLLIALILGTVSVVLSRYRNMVFRSGFIFSIGSAVIALVFLKTISGVWGLLFSGFLVTLSIVTVRYRIKKDMVKPTLSPELFKQLVKKLKLQNRKLKQQEKNILQQDPYLQEGRAIFNAELAEDTAEDVEKGYSDARLTMVQNARIQVKKALAKVKLGSYGYCEICKEAIDPARLKAYPQATKCLKCSQKAEAD